MTMDEAIRELEAKESHVSKLLAICTYLISLSRQHNKVFR